MPPAARTPRHALIFAGVDIAASRGLEIGPLNNPLVRKDEGEILYVDFADTATVRAKPYDASINPADIVEVDVVWAERPLREAVAAPVDYVVASHVIEHVPDLVGWLHDLAGVLKPGGVLSLVVPDKRYTFDIRRHDSTIGEVVEAYLCGYRRPSIRQMFDQCFSAVVVDREAAWARDLSAEPLPRLVGDVALQFAYDQAVELAQAPRYIDTHCWVFTPDSFLELLDLLAQLKLLPFTVASFTTTQPGEFEFFAQLRPADPSAPDAIRASIARSRPNEPGPAARLAATRRRLQAIEASRFWKATAPARWLWRRLRDRPSAP